MYRCFILRFRSSISRLTLKGRNWRDSLATSLPLPSTSLLIKSGELVANIGELARDHEVTSGKSGTSLSISENGISDSGRSAARALRKDQIAKWKVNPDLVARDADGKVNTVRYEAVNAMLLNEFLKEHQTVQQLKKQVAELTAGLQKVSAQLEVSKPAPQTALNNQ